MQTNQVALALAITVGVASSAAAQQNPASSSAESGQRSAPTAAPAEPDTNQWLASGFAGTDFGRSAESASADFGGTVGYLLKGKIGGEFAISLTPSFSFTPAAASVISGSPMVNTYMAHVIGVTQL